jgi:hypothetical protein
MMPNISKTAIARLENDCKLVNFLEVNKYSLMWDGVGEWGIWNNNDECLFIGPTARSVVSAAMLEG